MNRLPQIVDNEYGNHYREPKSIPVTLQRYAILGCDNQIIAVRSYPPIKPKDLKPFMVPIPDNVKVYLGWVWNGLIFERPTDV